jgi:hypothetical protein
MTTIIVCGGRTYNDAAKMAEVLSAIPNLTRIVHGARKGADMLADAWAKANGVDVTPVPADFAKHGRWGGLIRNRRMLREFGRIDLVVAFPGGAGTAHMVEAAKYAHVTVREVGE